VEPHARAARRRAGCGEAKPGQILISKRVLATTEELLQVESAGALSLKGFHRPIPAYDVVGLRVV
jgi:adenylate cyclase